LPAAQFLECRLDAFFALLELAGCLHAGRGIEQKPGLFEIVMGNGAWFGLPLRTRQGDDQAGENKHSAEQQQQVP